MLCPGFKQIPVESRGKELLVHFISTSYMDVISTELNCHGNFLLLMFNNVCYPVKLINSGSWPPCITFQLECHSNCHEWPCMKRSQTTTKHHALRCSKYSATHPLRYLWMKQPEDGPEESIWSTFSFWLLTESWRINPATFFRKEGIIYNKVNYQ